MPKLVSKMKGHVTNKVFKFVRHQHNKDSSFNLTKSMKEKRLLIQLPMFYKTSTGYYYQGIVRMHGY